MAIIMVAQWNKPDHYILACGFFLPSSSFFFFSSPNLSRRRLDVCHTSTHGVALVRAACEPRAVHFRSEMYCTRLAGNAGRKKIAVWAPSHTFLGLYLRN